MNTIDRVDLLLMKLHLPDCFICPPVEALGNAGALAHQHAVSGGIDGRVLQPRIAAALRAGHKVERALGDVQA